MTVTRRTFLKGAVAGTGAVLLGSIGAPAASGKIGAPSSGKAFLGAWCNVPGGGAGATPDKIKAFESMIGRKLNICLNYRGWSESFWPYKDPTRYEGWMAAGGRHPCVSFGTGGPSIPYIASGGADGTIKAIAGRCKNFGHPLFLRPWWEMNGDWMPWNASFYGRNTSKFRDAWRRMVEIFDKVGVNNVTWVWSPNVGTKPDEAWNDWKNYYPGDAYVDWIGSSGYNRGGIRWRELREAYTPLFSDYRNRKPFMIAETASVENGGSKAQWITNARNWCKNNDIDTFIWFHRAPNAREVFDWRVNTSSSSLTAYRGLAHDAYFNP